MKRLFAIFSFGAFISTMVSCTSVLSHKDTILPNRPMVYSMGVRLMDVNWIDQELCRIPLLIEETRQGKRITKVRVEPTGDIRLPGCGTDDIAFRWKVESCTASRADEPYTLSLRLTYVCYPGDCTQIIDNGRARTTICYYSYGREAYARVLVHRTAEGEFSMEVKNDIISGYTDIEPQLFIRNPGFWQQSLYLQLQPYIN